MPTRHLLGAAPWALPLVAIALVAAGQAQAPNSPASAGIAAETLRGHVEALGDASMLGRDTPGPGGVLAAQYVAHAFMMAGLQAANGAKAETEAGAEAGALTETEAAAAAPHRAYLQPFTVDGEEVTNVVGILSGSNPSAGAVVVGAHYDGVGSRNGDLMPAADDNASGTAILIVVAEALARSAASSGPLERTVVFVAFGSEEDGLLGAKHYCEHPVVPLSTTQAMINLDTIGRPRSERLEIVGWSRYRELSLRLEQAAADEGVVAVAGPSALWWRSDQAVFADAGVPAVWLLGHLRDDIHSREDAADRLDYAWMAKIARTLVASIRSEL